MTTRASLIEQAVGQILKTEPSTDANAVETLAWVATMPDIGKQFALSDSELTDAVRIAMERLNRKAEMYRQEARLLRLHRANTRNKSATVADIRAADNVVEIGSTGG